MVNYIKIISLFIIIKVIIFKIFNKFISKSYKYNIQEEINGKIIDIKKGNKGLNSIDRKIYTSTFNRYDNLNVTDSIYKLYGTGVPVYLYKLN